MCLDIVDVFVIAFECFSLHKINPHTKTLMFLGMGQCRQAEGVCVDLIAAISWTVIAQLVIRLACPPPARPPARPQLTLGTGSSQIQKKRVYIYTLQVS